MPLRQCIASHTHREYLTWLAWLDQELDNPSRSDSYLMQIAAEIRAIFAKKVTLSEFKLTFGRKEKPKPKTDNEREQKGRQTKSFFLAMLGLNKDGKRNRDRKTGSPTHRRRQ